MQREFSLEFLSDQLLAHEHLDHALQPQKMLGRFDIMLVY